jgi:hypothetical protein
MEVLSGMMRAVLRVRGWLWMTCLLLIDASGHRFRMAGAPARLLLGYDAKALETISFLDLAPGVTTAAWNG